MPELPEVQTTVKGLQVLLNEKIINSYIFSLKLRYRIPKKIIKISKGTKIIKIYRIGKYIIINLKNEYSLILHLGMSGRIKIREINNYKLIKHDHFFIQTKKYLMIFNDTRKFGFIDLIYTSKIRQQKNISILGIDALDKSLNKKYLYDKIKKSVVPIKQLLLNQKIISGIGNIYACEILFDSKISPLRIGKNIKLREIDKIIISIRKILLKAINCGGSTLQDYVATDGTLGNFQKNFKVYNKTGDKIGSNEIIRIIQYGRSTFYCPKIQK